MAYALAELADRASIALAFFTDYESKCLFLTADRIWAVLRHKARKRVVFWLYWVEMGV